MAEITIAQILDKLAEKIEPAEAQQLLALALEQCDIPVQKSYTPGQVMAIGTAIADAQRATLANSDIEAAREMERVLGPIIDGLKKDAPHKPKT